MDIETKLDLARKVGEEIVTEEELRKLFETKSHPVAYDGFEPSGYAHLGSGLMRSIQLQILMDAGIRFKLYVADWFAWINNKMGGNLENIQRAGNYLVEVWKACGVDEKKAEIIWASDHVKDPEYWKKVVSVAKVTTIDRMIRCGAIMGRRQKEMQYTSQVLYPAMQAADPFHMGADICQLGLDQRKVILLSREVGEKLKWYKPVAIHHHLLMGLQGPKKMGGFEENERMDEEIASKMAKSVPNSSIFVHDTPEDIKGKISSAFCPEKTVTGNPVLEMSKYIIFNRLKSFDVERQQKFGGSVSFGTYAELEKYYSEGLLHPSDLKSAVAGSLIEILEPVRKHFDKPSARKLMDVFKEAEITR
ncbi:MAG: tyrosine--tRNA ligase [Candidatus Aenigmarchaeota archaeon]|nr:tyrosine--tRNA ligase [Candidatus Aenigmarchaeota archaeon]